MKVIHKGLHKRWHKFTRDEQMANIGADVGREINWRKKGNKEYSTNAFYRALELLDFTIDDAKNKDCLGEILRVREVLCDYFMGENIYKSTDEAWEKYFYFFNYRARANK